MTKQVNAKILTNEEEFVRIFAYFVSGNCKLRSLTFE